MLVPEIADYELRRELRRCGFEPSIQRLNELAAELGYLALDTQTMRLAADFWAQARAPGSNQGTADPKELDCDVVLAAQAHRAGFIVATENVGHLARFVDARHWRDLS